jgi:hypothetical protein
MTGGRARQMYQRVNSSACPMAIPWAGVQLPASIDPGKMIFCHLRKTWF